MPLAPPRARALSDAFGVDEEILTRALEIAGDAAAATTDPTLTAYLEVSAASADSAFEAIATPGGYRRLLEGLGPVASEEEIPGGFRLAISAGDGGPGGSLEETVRVQREERSVAVVREGAGARAAFTLRALARGGQTWLVREAAVASADALLRNDSLRGRLAGTFAADLLGWARLL